MPDSHGRARHEHADHIEPIGLIRPTVALDPDMSRAGQLSLLSPVDSFHRKSELCTLPSLDLDERYQSIAFGNEIDVPVTVAKPALHDAPPFSSEPALRYPLSNFSKRLRGRGHGTIVGCAPGIPITLPSPFAPIHCTRTVQLFQGLEPTT